MRIGLFGIACSLLGIVFAVASLTQDDPPRALAWVALVLAITGAALWAIGRAQRARR
jgi:drug/metabolite transporter (DMT)-like permease